MDLAWLLLSFQGRIDRKTYAGAAFTLGLATSALKLALAGLSPGLQVLAALGFAIPALALMVKRLHDLGQSGVIAVLPVVGLAWLVAVASRRSGHLVLHVDVLTSFGTHDRLMLAVAVLAAGFTWWLAAVRGQPFENAFGAAPA